MIVLNAGWFKNNHRKNNNFWNRKWLIRICFSHCNVNLATTELFVFLNHRIGCGSFKVSSLGSKFWVNVTADDVTLTSRVILLMRTQNAIKHCLQSIVFYWVTSMAETSNDPNDSRQWTWPWFWYLTWWDEMIRKLTFKHLFWCWAIFIIMCVVKSLNCMK